MMIILLIWIVYIHSELTLIYIVIVDSSPAYNLHSGYKCVQVMKIVK
jgi:hypothetical protein